jgi:hypothetical protein
VALETLKSAQASLAMAERDLYARGFGTLCGSIADRAAADDAVARVERARTAISDAIAGLSIEEARVNLTAAEAALAAGKRRLEATPEGSDEEIHAGFALYPLKAAVMEAETFFKMFGGRP